MMTRCVAIVASLSVVVITLFAQARVASSGASPDPIAFSKLGIQQSAGIVTVIGEVQNRTARTVSFYCHHRPLLTQWDTTWGR